jgi:catechol 2,3-dioxygenase-like lactoylglutathione lyase family enzyme
MTPLCIARNCDNLARTQTFYEALGFTPQGPAADDPALANVLDATRTRSLHLTLGAQQLELTQCFPPGAPYPANARSDDLIFQHIAIVTTNIAEATARARQAGATPITQGGPQHLPAASGNVTAWKFRDPDGHPLEFLQFPTTEKWSGPALFLGYDHTAIATANASRAIAYYTNLGFTLAHRHRNQGPEQNQLDALTPATPEIITLTPQTAPPHLELLAYPPHPNPTIQPHPTDIAADRLILPNSPNHTTLTRDPDGHFVMLDGRGK